MSKAYEALHHRAQVEIDPANRGNFNSCVTLCDTGKLTCENKCWYNHMPCFQHVNSWPNIKFRTTGCERKHPKRAVRLSPGTSHGHISWMDRLLADSDVLKTCIKDSIMGREALFSFILALFYFHFKRKAVSLPCCSMPPAKGKYDIFYCLYCLSDKSKSKAVKFKSWLLLPKPVYVKPWG